MVEQGTHKPLVVGSSPTLATQFLTPCFCTVKVKETGLFFAFLLIQ